MILRYRLLVLFCSLTMVFHAQSIRKNFREMTAEEKTNLLDGFYQLRLGNDLVNDLAQFHNDFFNFDGTERAEEQDIHINLPDEPERDIFLAWHRMQMLELEHGLQEIYPESSLVYADWRIDDDETSPLWEEDFLGQFDEDWNLNRDLGGLSELPNSSRINNVQNISSNYLVYSNELERGNVHSGPHLWIGGTMSSRSSPRDPAFYFHHSFIDKLWQEWEDVNGSSAFIRTDMIRYNGTYFFGGDLLPSVNPNDIVKSNDIGVFYAENQFVAMHDYTVSNIHLPEENFYYQYTIEVGNNFVVPNLGKAKIQSVNEVVLKPGFSADSGSELVVRIDVIDPLKQGVKLADRVRRNQIPFSGDYDDEIAYYYLTADVEESVTSPKKAYPNPFDGMIYLEGFVEEGTVTVEMYDAMGLRVLNKTIDLSRYQAVEGLDRLANGIYVVRVSKNGTSLASFRMIKK